MQPNQSPVVVVGASAGGIQALLDLIAELPSTFASPVFVVVHVGTSRSLLPSILARGGRRAASLPTPDETGPAGPR